MGLMTGWTNPPTWGLRTSPGHFGDTPWMWDDLCLATRCSRIEPYRRILLYNGFGLVLVLTLRLNHSVHLLQLQWMSVKEQNLIRQASEYYMSDERLDSPWNILLTMLSTFWTKLGGHFQGLRYTQKVLARNRWQEGLKNIKDASFLITKDHTSFIVQRGNDMCVRKNEGWVYSPCILMSSRNWPGC